MTKEKEAEDLIAKNIIPDPLKGNDAIGDYRLRESYIHVWALVGHYRAVKRNKIRVAEDYEIPLEEVDAALAFYKQNRREINKRLRQNRI
jgi:uncharacterized protein (DUF433 family)